MGKEYMDMDTDPLSIAGNAHITLSVVTEVRQIATCSVQMCQMSNGMFLLNVYWQ